VSGGVVVGGVVVAVSTTLAVSAGIVVVAEESTVVEVLVLSVDVSEAFLVELHADVAIINEPAIARLKIIFFIVCCFNYKILTVSNVNGFKKLYRIKNIR
jgi:hypothetical protein